MTTVNLRAYQADAIERIRARYAAKDRSTLLVLPTGCGKTVVFAEVVRRVAAKGGRSLVIAHREELIAQARTKLSAVAPELLVDVEMATARAGSMADAVVASVQTLSRPVRLDLWPRDHFAIIVIDEAHRATAASYRKILDHFAAAKVLGVTATPDRQDRAALAGVFDSVAFSYEIRDAISAGFLCPIRQYRVEIEDLDFGGVHTRGGDLDEGELEAIVGQDVVLEKIATAIRERAGERPTVIFTPRVASAHRLAEVLSRLGVPAAGLDGTIDRDERRRVLERFDRGELRALTNCSLFTEGWDCPRVACVAMARPTKSRAMYAQCIGRGTRLFPGKDDLLVLDFAGNAGRHRLVNPVDILGGDRLSEAAKKRAQQLLEEDGELTTVEAIAQAEAEERDERRQHQELYRRARVRFEQIDPFGMLELDFERAAGEDAKPESESARGYLIEQLRERHNLKGRDVAGLTAGQARELLRAIEARRKAGLCTYNQARALARWGLRTDVSFQDAREAMDALAAAGWRKSAAEKLFEDPRFAPVAPASTGVAA